MAQGQKVLFGGKHEENFYFNDNDFSFVKKAIDQYWVTVPYRKSWTLARSSVLRENGKSIELYEWDKAFDNNTDTAWVEGVPGFGRNGYSDIHWLGLHNNRSRSNNCF